jgi:hypothetical protein
VGSKRIARELGVSRGTVKRDLDAGGWQPFKRPERRKRLDGLEDWLRERFRRHRGNADVVRQELAAEKGVVASLRTVQRALAPYRQELLAEARATVRFETAPGRQLQIDFGERVVEIGGRKVKVFLFVPTLGYSRRSTCGRSATNARRAGSTGSRARFSPSAACRRRCSSITRVRSWPRCGDTHGGVQRQAAGVRPALGLRAAGLRPLSRAYQGQDGERRRLREEERRRRPRPREREGVRGASHLAAWERDIANARVHGTTGETPLPLRARRGRRPEAAGGSSAVPRLPHARAARAQTTARSRSTATPTWCRGG